MTPIATRLHKLRELVGNDEFVAACEAAPHYVIGADVMEIVTRSDVQRSIAAMVEAKIAHLPYPTLLVEFSVLAGVRRFVLLSEEGGGIRAWAAALLHETAALVSEHRPMVAILADEVKIVGTTEGAEGQAIALAVALALLMLNTKGVSKQVIDTTRINRTRGPGTGKVQVPRHTVLRIGTIYDRAGRAVIPGRRGPMPVHLRAGHTRMQAYGEHHSLRRPIYIPPVLVNFREDDEWTIPRRLVRV